MSRKAETPLFETKTPGTFQWGKQNFLGLVDLVVPVVVSHGSVRDDNAFVGRMLGWNPPALLLGKADDGSCIRKPCW